MVKNHYGQKPKIVLKNDFSSNLKAVISGLSVNLVIKAKLSLSMRTESGLPYT